LAAPADFRQLTRAIWASGDWDTHSRLIEPAGGRPRAHRPPSGLDLVDVGTGMGEIDLVATESGINLWAASSRE
jgi:hypothetical protein